MAQDEIHQGSCRCGRVTFAAGGDPNFVSACHCESCRRSTGAAFSVWAGFSDAAVEWRGETRASFDGAPGVRRGFCKSCGTPLSYQSDQWPGETHLLIGTFNDPSPFSPRSDYRIEERLAWVKPVVEKV